MPAAVERTPELVHVRALLLDIEGTTTPIEFVRETLFPYARARVEEFLLGNVGSEDVAQDVAALQRHHEALAAETHALPAWSEASPQQRAASAAAFARWLIDRDSKFGALKSLQGRIWEAGYLSGELVAPVYPDVPPAFSRWRRQGRAIAIFSSGSVLAQRLLFAHTTGGDLTPFIAAYFDTNTGPKQEPESYRKIASGLRLAAREVLFVSDSPTELAAARRAGMETRLCTRAAAASAFEVSEEQRTVHTFDAVLA